MNFQTPTAYVVPAPITAPIAGMPATVYEPPPPMGQWHMPQQPVQPSQRTMPEQLAPPPAQVKKVVCDKTKLLFACRLCSSHLPCLLLYGAGNVSVLDEM